MSSEGKSTPRSASAAWIVAFLDFLPAERAGIRPIGYEYREYKNWRGIPKPRRCPFCKKAKGEIRKVRGAFQGVCPSCGATGPKRRITKRRCWRGMERIEENSAPGVKREQRQNRIDRRSFANHYAAGKAKAVPLGGEELGRCFTRYTPPGIELGRSNRVFFRSLNSSSAISIGSHRNRLSIKFSP